MTTTGKTATKITTILAIIAPTTTVATTTVTARLVAINNTISQHQTSILPQNLILRKTQLSAKPITIIIIDSTTTATQFTTIIMPLLYTITVIT